MYSDSLQNLKKSLELSRRLLTLMGEGAWDEAAELEAERFQMIQKGVAAEPEQDLQEKIDLLRQIQVLDREIESIGRQGKSKLSNQLRQIRQGRKAGKAYRQSR